MDRKTQKVDQKAICSLFPTGVNISGGVYRRIDGDELEGALPRPGLSGLEAGGDG